MRGNRDSTSVENIIFFEEIPYTDHKVPMGSKYNFYNGYSVLSSQIMRRIWNTCWAHREAWRFNNRQA